MKKQILIILFITILAYLNIFNNQLVIDDHVFVGKYHPSLSEAFAGAVPPGHEGVYRPVRGMLYSLYNQLWVTNVFGYHLHSLLVHLASTILVYFIVKTLIFNFQFSIFNKFSISKFSNFLPFITALLFGLHPVHTETITYIASAMDSIGIVFFLIAFYLYLSGKNRPAIMFGLLAFFTTEMTLTLPLLIVFYDWIAKKLSKKKLIVYSGFGLTAILYLVLRFGALSITTRGPYLANSFYLTMLTMTKVLIQYLWVLLWPINLVNNHIISPGIEAFVYRNYQTTAIAAQSIFNLDILLSVTVIIVLLGLILKLRKSYPLISFAIGIFFIGLLPVMELVPQGSMMNERSLYISSLGFVILLGYGILNISNKKLLLITIIIVALFYGGRTYVRNQDWHDDITLWQKDVKQNPDQNAYARFALGNAYNDKKQYQKAIDQYLKSVTINPGFAVGWASLGRTYADMGKIPEAITNYKQALVIDPNFWEVKNNLNNIYNHL